MTVMLPPLPPSLFPCFLLSTAKETKSKDAAWTLWVVVLLVFVQLPLPLSLVRNKTVARRMRETQSDITLLAVVEFSSKRFKTYWQRQKHWDDAHYETLSHRTHIRVELHCISWCVLWFAERAIVVFGWKPFHCCCLKWVCCPLLSRVSRPATSVFQCAVQTLRGVLVNSVFFGVSAKMILITKKKRTRTQRLYRTHASQLSDSCREMWLFGSVLHGFLLLASVWCLPLT